MPIDKPIPSPRASSVRFILQDDTEVLIPPITIDQMRAVLRLDPDAGHRETHAENILRLAAQFRILVGPANAHLTEKLTIHQAAELAAALYAAGCGMDPAQYAQWQMIERQTGRVRDAYQVLRDLEGLTIQLATELSKLPSEIGAMPVADARSLADQIGKTMRAETDFQIALHGATRK